MNSDILATSTTLTRELVDELHTLFTSCGSADPEMLRKADNIRFNKWANQHADNRKHDVPGKEAFPWDGASDTKPGIVDGVIDELTSVLTGAFWRALARPSKLADDREAQYAVSLVDWTINTALAGTMVEEVELSAQHLLAYGWVVLHPCWVQRIALERVTVTLMDMAQIGATLARENPARPELANLMAIASDPTMEDMALQILREVHARWIREQASGIEEFPAPDDQELSKGLAQLRIDGTAEFTIPTVAANLPSITALRPMDEVVVPPETTAIQDARAVFQVEYCTEASLRERVRTQGYSKEWVDLVVKSATGRRFSPSAVAVGLENTYEDLVEVIHATHRAVDRGISGVYCTTFSALHRKDQSGNLLVAKHELINYPHGEYPYVSGKREHLSRSLLASRGIPEVIECAQQEIKDLKDGVIDWTSIGVIPPVNTYKTPWDTRYKFGPAVRNMVMPGKEPQFMPIPANGVGPAMTAHDKVEYLVAWRCGLEHPLINPSRVQTMQARVVNNFLAMWSRAFQQVVALAQSYMSDLEFSRVTGAPQGWLESHRRKLGASVNLTFDVRELNEELMMKRVEAVNKAVLPADAQGVISRSKWVEFMLRAISPSWATELVMPAAEASQALFNAVRNDVALMFLGNPPQMVENDPTAPSKLQYLQQVIATNPNYQQALANQEGRFAKLMELYVKNLTFSATQEKNKMVGRIGVDPAEIQGNDGAKQAAVPGQA